MLPQYEDREVGLAVAGRLAPDDGALVVVLEAQLSRHAYGEGAEALVGCEREGLIACRRRAIVGVDAKLEQPLGKVFALSLGYNLVADTRPFYVEYQQQNNSGDNQVDNLSYFRHLVTLVLAVRI